MMPGDCQWDRVSESVWRCVACGRERAWVKPGPPPAINCPLSPPAAAPVWTSHEEMPSVGQQAWNLAGSLAAFISDGCALVDAEEYARRLRICETCDRRKNRRCLECGCHVAAKAKARSQQCPIKKW